MSSGGNIGQFILWLLDRLLSGYSLLILIRALLSWFSPNPHNRLYILLIGATEPVLAPLRRIIPVSGIDFSPLIAILLIDLVVKRVLLSLLSSLLGF
jgi:YggT family protein